MDKQNAIIKLNNIKSGDNETLSKIEKAYTNIFIDNEFEDFERMFQEFQKDLITIDKIKVFKDGDYIFFHTLYNSLEKKSGFDIIKTKNDKILSYWSVFQDNIDSKKFIKKIKMTNKNETTETTNKNKDFIRNFITTVLIKGDTPSIRKYITDEKDKKISSLELIFEEFKKRGLVVSYDSIKIILGDGNYILSVCKGFFLNKQVLFYDLFKIESNMIVEHWDTMDDTLQNIDKSRITNC